MAGLLPLVVSWQALLTALLLALLLVPIMGYLWAGWPTRRAEIVEALSDRAVRLYFAQFFPKVTLPRGNVAAFFATYYNRRYGRRYYVLPFAVLTILATLFVGFAVWHAVRWPLDGVVPETLEAVVVAAVAGAYAWIVVEMIGRCRRRELAPIDLYGGSLRFAIAVPLALSFTTLFKETAAIPLAFLLGTFPTKTLFTIGRRLASRKLGLSEAGEEGHSELEKIQGITPGVAERLQDEGVSTILQLAYCDPIDLAIRANLAFNFSIDLVSQGLAWLYFEDNLVTARKYSLRGAYEIHVMMRDREDGTPEEQASAKAAVRGLAAAIVLDEDVLLGILRQIAYDPYTSFNYAIWAREEED